MKGLFFIQMCSRAKKAVDDNDHCDLKPVSVRISLGICDNSKLLMQNTSVVDIYEQFHVTSKLRLTYFLQVSYVYLTVTLSQQLC